MTDNTWSGETRLIGHWGYVIERIPDIYFTMNRHYSFSRFVVSVDIMITVGDRVCMMLI